MEESETMTDGFPLFEKQYAQFAKFFKTKKRDREVKFYKNLGKVHLTLEFDNGEFDFEVSVP